MTPLTSVTVVYGAGLLVGPVFLLPGRVLLVIAGGIAVLLLVASDWHRLLCAVGVLGVVVGQVASRARELDCSVIRSPGRMRVIVRFLERPTTGGIVTGKVLYEPGGCRGTLVINAGSGDIAAGAAVVVVGTLLPNHILRATRIKVLGSPLGGVYAVRDHLQRRIRLLYGKRAGLIEALILARQTGVEPRVKRHFRDAGMAHLLAISGLHVGLIAAWLGFLFRGVGLRRLQPAGSVVCIWLYVALIGFPAAATRAAVFINIYFGARLLERHPGPRDVISTAALSLFIVNPGFALSAGSWLSIAAVWGTVEAFQRFRAASGWQRLILSSIGATLATQPITALTFGTVSPVGILSNLVAIPLAALAIPAVFLGLLTGEIAAAGSGVLLGLIERVALAASSLPGASVHGEPGVGFALPWLGMLWVAYWLALKRPAPARVLATGLLALSIGIWGATALSFRPEGSGHLELYFLDVGQGDAIVIRTPRGRWITVDGGPRAVGVDMGRKVVTPFLRRHRAGDIDLAVISHGDADHLGGVPALIETFSPSTVIEPGQPLGTELYEEFQAAVAAAGASWVPGRAGDSVVLDSVVLRVLHPSARWFRRTTEPNENSLVIRLSYRGFDALLTGDAGIPVESVLTSRIAPVEVLKVGHHGSRTSTSAELLESARPRVAVISVGRNRYGHPSPAVLRRIARHGLDIYRTDQGGTVSIETDGHYFVVRQGVDHSPWERLKCRIMLSLPSSASSSSRNACSRKLPGSSRTYFTT